VGPATAGTDLPDAALVAERLAAVRHRIEGIAGLASGVEVVAVTKGFAPALAGVALGAGLRLLGENYAQELLAKAAWVDAQRGEAAARHQRGREAGGDDPGAPHWQFIGQLQRNKVRQLAPHVHRWQSVDRAPLVDESARRAPGTLVFVQVNTTGEPQKGGCDPAETERLVARARDAGLVVDGLMTVGPTDAGARPGPAFRLLRGLVDRLGLDQCCMGMTDDLDVAVHEGSTMIRIGRALFGPRPARGRVGH
jgi:uncharacterized pyridoxal phosphate-containing UPF0001 family protein